MNPKPISRLEDHLGYWLRCLSNFVSDSFAEKLAAQDISVAQWVVLRILFDHEDLTLHEAARLVGVDKSSLSRMIDRLVQRELVTRSEGQSRREIGLNLTPGARKLVPKLSALADENDRSFFQCLTAKQRQVFVETIHHLLRANGWDLSQRGADRMK